MAAFPTTSHSAAAISYHSACTDDERGCYFHVGDRPELLIYSLQIPACEYNVSSSYHHVSRRGGRPLVFKGGVVGRRAEEMYRFRRVTCMLPRLRRISSVRLTQETLQIQMASCACGATLIALFCPGNALCSSATPTSHRVDIPWSLFELPGCHS